jgi:GGDEF domain-containing protein/DNA-binding LacI/PurR family transcriptional regulator
MSSHPDNQSSHKRYTIGFLSEKASHGTESVIFRGAEQAAEKYDVNLIYFAPLEDNGESVHYGYSGAREDEQVRRSHDQLKAHLDQFELDGLFCIGWARIFNDANGPYLLDRLADLRMVSIGKSLSDSIPSVIMPGGPYVKKLALHLAHEHKLRHIAYICPWSEDSRLDSYIEAMQEAGQFDDRLVVRTADLDVSLEMDQRMQRALAILLDERQLRVDAVMVMSPYESKFMLEALQARGLRVPEDVALVCYDDDPIIEYAKPSITTIEYPYRELGYAACELIVRQLENQEVPAITEVSASIFYRDSCGCTVNNVKPMQLKPPVGPAQAAAVDCTPAAIGEQLRSLPNIGPVDYERLVEAFLSSLQERSGRFLDTFSQEIYQLQGQFPYGLSDLADRFREALLPCVGTDPARYELAEALWFGARHILKNYISGLALTLSIREKEHHRIVSHIYQHLQAAALVTDVSHVLNQYLGWLQVPSMCLLLHPADVPDPGASRLFFMYGEYFDFPQDAGLLELYRRYRDRLKKRLSLVVSPLLVNGERLGYAWADPGFHGTNTITDLIDQIGNSVKNAQVQEENREKETSLAYYASVDSLTRLFNRRFFYDALARTAADCPSFSVMYIDIDGFKEVNDTLGHDAGDRLLSQIADRIRDVLSAGAFPLTHPVPRMGLSQMSSIFRLGGDEFTALLRTDVLGEVANYADRLCRALRQPYTLGSRSVQVSASVGIARYPEDSADSVQLLKLADLALYQAKASKDQYCFHETVTDNGRC